VGGGAGGFMFPFYVMVLTTTALSGGGCLCGFRVTLAELERLAASGLSKK